MNDREIKLEKIIPEKSVLWRELKQLQKYREIEQKKYEQTADKMGYETSPYRRANMAVEMFVSEWLPKVERAQIQLTEQAKINLLNHEAAVLRFEYGIKTPVDRRSELRIWQAFLVTRYRDIKPSMQRAKRYQPNLVENLIVAWKAFRKEGMIWKYGGMPWDGSRAMHAMFSVLLQIRLLASINE
jgi:hypothetical protein